MSSSIFPNPALLTHPNIPKPLHSVNPRSIKGDAWWDEVRRKAYAEHDFHCWACGVHKTKAMFHQWLEGHEHYNIDYPNGIVTLEEIVALCHACHNFIHSGRLWAMYKKREIPQARIEKILEHGLAILDKNNLKPFWSTLAIYYMVGGLDKEAALRITRVHIGEPEQIEIAPWEQWRLVLDGKEHFSPFKNIDDWADHYGQR